MHRRILLIHTVSMGCVSFSLPKYTCWGNINVIILSVLLLRWQSQKNGPYECINVKTKSRLEMWLQCYTEVWSVSKPGPWMPSLLTDTHWRCTFDPINWISRPFEGYVATLDSAFCTEMCQKSKSPTCLLFMCSTKQLIPSVLYIWIVLKAFDGNWKSGIASE